jgi:cellulose synthase/poly-beta-1,6-N-acetylglucosamine synthase-like glycosyltransferase
MTSLAKINLPLEYRTRQSDDPPRRIGEILLDNGFTTPKSLSHALALQSHSEANIGEILLADESVTQSNLHKALSEQAQLQFESNPAFEIKNSHALPFALEEMLAYNFIPISQNASSYKVAIGNPAHISKIKSICTDRGINAQFVLCSNHKIQAQIAEIGKQSFSAMAENICPVQYSCRSLFLRSRPNLITIVAFAIVLSLVVTGKVALVLFSLAAIVFLGNGLLKLACLLAYLFKQIPDQPAPRFHKKLERVSILVPIFKEAEIVDRLILRLQQLDYPKELLEICLICEEEDKSTQDMIAKSTLPSHFRKLVAPKGSIQTKPRAMNYALNFCSGTIVGVYDAEDAPEYDQVYKAVRHLQRSDDKVVCVQARLDFFNQDTNWIARCFTIEYAILFRVILRGLQKLDLPIPLGGTSMFIRREALENWGGWDAHNVTEDADLGMRLFRQGLRIECLDSTTYEEANFKLRSWIKQRSRWLKGFIITWLTHMRAPRLLFSEMGAYGFVAFNVLMLGTVATYLLIPLLLPYWIMSFGYQPALLGQIPTFFIPVLVIVLALGEPFLLVLGLYATKTKKLRSLRPTLLTMFAYWPLASFAAYKAIYEVVFAPSYWDKTEHGLNDHSFSSEIDELTLPEWRKST